MNNEDKKVKSKNFKTLFVVIGVLLLLIGIFVFIFNSEKIISSISNKKLSGCKNYIYKIRYYSGPSETYICLLPDNVIKRVDLVPTVRNIPGTPGMEHTGIKNYETTINLSKEAKKIVISVFDELYKESGKKEFNADNMKLTKYQDRILLATITNDEDCITMENNLNYKKITEELNSKNNDYKIVNSKTILDNSTENELVNKIANYLNDIINKDFDEINTNSKEIIENTDIKENSGVNLKLKLIYTEPASQSFIYTIEGQLGGNAIYKVKGYTFNYDGNIRESIIDWVKEDMYEDALNNFMKTDLYINYKDQLNKDWESILYDNMYLTGNWYLDDDKIVFLIPAYLLGFDESIEKIIKIDVKVNYGIGIFLD